MIYGSLQALHLPPCFAQWLLCCRINCVTRPDLGPSPDSLQDYLFIVIALAAVPYQNPLCLPQHVWCLISR